MPSNPMELLAGLLTLLCAGLCVAGAAGVAYWMVEPINRAAGNLHLSTRFLLIDFIGLMVLLQGALAIVGSAFDPQVGSDRSPYWSLLAAVMLLVVVLWGAAVSVVSRAGITRTHKRLVVTVVLIPATLAVMIAWPLALVAFVSGMVEQQPRVLLLAVGGGLLLTGATVVLRRLSFWSLRGTPDAETLAKLSTER